MVVGVVNSCWGGDAVVEGFPRTKEIFGSIEK